MEMDLDLMKNYKLGWHSSIMYALMGFNFDSDKKLIVKTNLQCTITFTREKRICKKINSNDMNRIYFEIDRYQMGRLLNNLIELLVKIDKFDALSSNALISVLEFAVNL